MEVKFLKEDLFSYNKVNCFNVFYLKKSTNCVCLKYDGLALTHLRSLCKRFVMEEDELKNFLKKFCEENEIKSFIDNNRFCIDNKEDMKKLVDWLNKECEKYIITYKLSF